MCLSERKVITAIEDCKGVLCPLEFDYLPFVPVRMFYVTDVPTGVFRGGHAHINGKQILICIKGSISVYLYDGMEGYSAFHMDPNHYIYVPNLVWNRYMFNIDSIMLVLCSNKYEESDYIRNLENFKKLKEK